MFTYQIVDCANSGRPHIILIHNHVFHDVLLHQGVCGVSYSYVTNVIIICISRIWSFHTNTGGCHHIDVAQWNMQFIVPFTIFMVYQFLKLTLRDAYTQRTQTCRIMLLAKAHLHVRCVIAHSHFEGLWLCTNINEVLRSFIHVCFDRYGYKLHIFDDITKIILCKNVLLANLHINDLSMNIKLWLTSVSGIG